MEPPKFTSFVCHLHYRPLREGDGDGDAPPWTVETFDDSEGAAMPGQEQHRRAGPALDALSELARAGGHWLAYATWDDAVVPRHRDMGYWGQIRGEYLVRDRSAEPLATWRARWPIASWERGSSGAITMLAAPGVPIARRWRAAFEMARATLAHAPLRGGSMRLRAENLVRRVDDAEPNITALLAEKDCDAELAERQFATLFDQLRDLNRLIRNGGNGNGLEPGEFFDMRDYNAKVDAWERAAATAIRRVVGDAWFVARAEPNAPRM